MARPNAGTAYNVWHNDRSERPAMSRSCPRTGRAAAAEIEFDRAELSPMAILRRQQAGATTALKTELGVNFRPSQLSPGPACHPGCRRYEG